ncbi:MAG: phosphatase PAP2 family protein [Dehalococcoidia bacterium]|nr:phosphatase PAP2 family protein [Dehalococcoidia bacterium]
MLSSSSPQPSEEKGVIISAIVSADETIFFWINGFAGKVPIFDWLMRLVGDDYLIFTIMALILISLWVGFRSASQRELNQRTVLCAAFGVGLACAAIHLFMAFGPDRLRPSDAYPALVNLLAYGRGDPSFPSESVAVAFAFATGVWLSKRGGLGAVMLLMAALLAFARVYVGVHYPLDVVAGAAIGILSSLAAQGLLRLFEPVPTWLLKGMRRIYLA